MSTRRSWKRVRLPPAAWALAGATGAFAAVAAGWQAFGNIGTVQYIFAGLAALVGGMLAYVQGKQHPRESEPVAPLDPRAPGASAPKVDPLAWRGKYLDALLEAVDAYLDTIVLLPVVNTRVRLLDIPGLLLQRSELVGKRRSSAVASFRRAFGPLRVKGISDAYKKSLGSLAVIGGPGSGKTVALHVLTRELIREARKNTDAPVPILVSAASWAVDERSAGLEEWLSKEVPLLGGVVAQLFRPGRSVLLVDALDELPSRFERRNGGSAQSPRADLVQALQAVPGLVVACRSEQFEQVVEELGISNIFELLQLREEDILAYASSVPAVAALLTEEPTLRPVASNPLMLSLLCAAEDVSSRRGVERMSPAEVVDRIMESFVAHRYQRERHSVEPQGESPAIDLDEIYSRLGALGMADAGGGGNRNLFTMEQLRTALITDAAEKLVRRMNIVISDNGWERFLHAKLRDHFAFRHAQKAIKDDDATVRDSAAWALWQIPDPRAVDVLLAAIDDSDPYVRGSAASALGRIGDPRALPILRLLLGDYTPVVSMYGSSIADVAGWAIDAIKTHNLS